MRNLVLWGHHVDEYREMFALSRADLNTNLLEFGAGPSGVNSELHEKGLRMVSCDPLFVLDKSTLLTKASLIFEEMLDEFRQEIKKFDVERYGGLEGLVETRRAGMRQFFADYDIGLSEKRYVPATGYELSFKDFAFDFALCPHYLFADLDAHDIETHLNIIRELARVAKEVRIFPLIDRFGQPSTYLGPVLLGLQQEHYGAEVREVSYHLQPKGNAMLRVWAEQCQLD